MKKIMYAGINVSETTGEYTLGETHEIDFAQDWGDNIPGYLINAAEDGEAEEAVREAMAREYAGAIHDLPQGAIVITSEDGHPVECYWVADEDGTLKIRNTETGQIVARITTNHSMSVENALECAGYEYINDNGHDESGWDIDGALYPTECFAFVGDDE
jgi:hypothetical protein